jgi:hypothetical protein
MVEQVGIPNMAGPFMALRDLLRAAGKRPITTVDRKSAVEAQISAFDPIPGLAAAATMIVSLYDKRAADQAV